MSSQNENAPPVAAAAAAAASSSSGKAVTTTKRLVIRDIEVENFKSYAGRHVIGPFHKTFTAVIGPNGSGKSNVIDSMLFVFGKSARKIRVEGKMADLIHNSAAHPNVDSASVTVNFVEIVDNAADPHQREEVPRSNLSITRQVSRSGASQYKIDHRNATQKAVVDLLLSRGVDLEHNRFLILQGEVEQIAMMKPRAEKPGEEGLVEYFDDLIGTNQLLEKIDEATRKAAEAFEARIDALDKMQSAKKELAKVEDAKDQCIDYITKQNDLHRMISVIVQKRVADEAPKLREQERLLDELAEQRRNKEELAAESAARVQGHKRDVAACDRDRAKMEKERDAAAEERQKVEEELAARKQQADLAERARKRETDKVKRIQAACATLRAEAKALDGEIADVDAAQKEAEAFVAEKEQDFDRQRDEVERRIAPLRKRKDALINELAPFENRFQMAQQDVVTLQTQLQGVREQRERAARDTGELAARIRNGQQRLSELDAAAQRIEQDEQLRRGAAERLDEARATLQVHQERKAEVANVIEQLKREAKDGDKDDQITSFLCAQRSLGSGYLGPLRSLGRIDERYDVAAGVAGGSAWSFHVVDTPETATKAMNLLKAENRGRASFMPLSKLQQEWGNQMAAAEGRAAPQGARKLFDLIRCDDDRVKVAFFFAVRTTVVADSIARARAIALNGPQQERLRAVTVAGEIVEPTGTITGGGQQKPKGAGLRGGGGGGGGTGGVKPASDRRAILEQLTALQSQLKEAHDNVIAAGTEVNRLERELDRVGGGAGPGGAMENARRNKQARAQLQKDISDCTRRLEAIHAKLGVSSSQGMDAALGSDAAGEEARLMMELNTAEDIAAEKKAELDAQRKKMTALEREIQGASGAAYEALRQRMEDCRRERTELGKKLAALRQSKTRTETKLEAQEREAEKLLKNLDKSLAEEQAREAESVKELQSQAEQLVLKIEAIAERLAAVNKKAAEARKRLADEQAVETQHAHELEGLKKQIGEQMDILKPQRDQMAKLTLAVDDRDARIIDNVEKYGTVTLKSFRRNADMMGDDNDDDSSSDDSDDDAAAVAAAQKVGAAGRNNKQAAGKKASPSGKKNAAAAAAARNKKKNAGDSSSNDDDDQDGAAKKMADSDSDDEDDDDPFALPKDGARNSAKNNKGKPGSKRGGATGGRPSSNSSSQKPRVYDFFFADGDEFVPDKFSTWLTPKLLRRFDGNDTRVLSATLGKELEELKEKIDFEAVAVWNELDVRFKAAKAEHDEVNATFNTYRKREEELKAERRSRFLATFGVIQRKLKEVYQTITRSGDAELELVDSSDPFEGIRFTVRPPRKAWKAIGNLSGGEKTLSSLALVFALHHIKPTPVYVLDEIDAALDFRNVAIVGKYILEKGIGAQFIIISLRNNMFELAHQIVGISKVSDCTRSIVISPKFLSDRINEAVLVGRKTANNNSSSSKAVAGAVSAPPSALQRHDYFGTTAGATAKNNQGSNAGTQQRQQQQQPPRGSGGFQHRVEEEEDE